MAKMIIKKALKKYINACPPQLKKAEEMNKKNEKITMANVCLIMMEGAKFHEKLAFSVTREMPGQ